MRTVSVVNQKGGCGKTTTAVNVAAAFAQLDKRVLLVDLDPQSHVTSSLGRNPDSFERTVLDALMSPEATLSEIIVSTGAPGVDLVPSNILLANAEVRLAGAGGVEKRVDRCLDDVRHRYELCVIDCPPSLGILTANALAAGDDVIVPVSVDYRGLEGLQRLVETIELMRDPGRGSPADHIHLLLTFVDKRGALCRQVRQELHDRFAGMVLQTVIHRNVRLAEAPTVGMSVLAYAPRSQGAADYRALAREVLTGQYHAEKSGIGPARRTTPKGLTAMFRSLRTSSGGSAGRPTGLDAFETT